MRGQLQSNWIESFAHREAREADAALDGAVLAQLCLALDEAHQEREVIGIGGGGLLDEVGAVLADKREVQVVEMGVERFEIVIAWAFHAGSPSPSLLS